MTDLKRLREWHLSEAQQWLDMFDTEQDSESPDDGSMHESGERWKNHRETARILSLLVAVREGCNFHFAAADDSSTITINAPENDLRRLAELLEGE